MPNDGTHILIGTIVLSSIITFYLIKFIYIAWAALAAFTLAYLFGTFYLSPDIDMNSKPYKRWGLIKFIWWPYQKLVPHRSISHHIVWGPLSIIGYLALVTSPLWVLSIQLIDVEMLLVVMGGLAASMIVHIITDRTWSGIN